MPDTERMNTNTQQQQENRTLGDGPKCGTSIQILSASAHFSPKKGTFGRNTSDRRFQDVPTGFRRCYKCREVLPLEGFPRDQGSPLGRGYLCTDCNRNQSLAYVEAHREQARAYARDHYRRNRDRYLKHYREWGEEHPGAGAARQAVLRATQAGRLFWPDTCDVCGCDGKSFIRHHSDYRRPLWLITVCRSCHKKLHAMSNELQSVAGVPDAGC